MHHARITSKTATKLIRTAEDPAKVARPAKLALSMRIVMVGTATRLNVHQSTSRALA
jgi:hypothetical protein